MSDLSRRSFLRSAATTVAGVVGAGLAASAARAAGQLSNEEIIRAWKDEAFRNSLTPEQLAQLPQHPAGMVEVDSSQLDDDLAAISGRTRGRGSICGSRRACGCRA